jgi:uncharacterized protein (TIGR00106 family)
MVLLEFSVSPLGEGESVSQYVARSLDLVDKSGLAYQLHAMGTIVEGELDEVLDLMRRCIEAVAADCPRVTCTAKLDYRQGHEGRLQSKVASVEQKLGRALNRPQSDN